MRAHLITLVCLLVAAPAVLQEDASAFDWRVEPSVSRLFGDTTYRLSALGEAPGSPGTLTEFRSTLEFPLDVALAGLAVRWEPSPEEIGHWAFEVGVSVGVTDPSNLMTDRDWIGDEQVAYTESESKADLVLLTAGASYELVRRRRVSLSLVARFDYERISQDIIGFDGWVADIGTGIQGDISGTEPAIDYEVTYATPQLGLRSTAGLGQHTALTLLCAAGPAFASDRVDHLLRGKASEADAVGFGLYSSAELNLLPGSVLGRRVSVGLVAELRYFSAEGDQTQRWYEDDGETPAGTEITGIPYEFRSLQYSIGLKIGIIL